MVSSLEIVHRIMDSGIGEHSEGEMIYRVGNVLAIFATCDEVRVA